MNHTVIYTPSGDLLNNNVTFRDFNQNIIILTDNDIPNAFMFEDKPVFTIQDLQQFLDAISTNKFEDEDAIHHYLSQTQPSLHRRLKYWKMNLLHLITYFPKNNGDTREILSSLLDKYPNQATTSDDIHGMTPLYRAVLNLYRGKFDQECYDLLLSCSPPTVVHQAIQAGISWKHLRPIVMAKINALTMEDKESRLVPFMIAAERCYYEHNANGSRLVSLSMVYELLCLKPDSIKEYDVMSMAKRSVTDVLESSCGRDAKRSRLET